MDVKLSGMLLTLFGVLTLAGCQTPLKSTPLNQNTEEQPTTLVPDILDSDGDGVSSQSTDFNLKQLS